MKESFQMVLGLCYPLISIALIVLAATRKYLPGKPWLIAFLAAGLVNMIGWQIPQLLMRFGADFDVSRFYDVMRVPLSLINLIGFCMLIPFILSLANHPFSNGNIAESQQGLEMTGDTSSPYYGVHGWLKFFVIVNIYVSPIIFAIQQIIGFIGLSNLAGRYPGILVVGIIEAGVGIFLVIKWIMIALRLRDITPGVVQEAKRWLLIVLGWNLLSTVLAFLSGMDPEDIAPSAIKGLFQGIIAFAIWYSYFNVSKRVKATYPDWNQ